MSEARMFTKEELKEMGTPIAERIQAAIDARDLVKAKELAQQMHRESLLILHDTYLIWLTGLLTFIGRRYGDEALEEALRESSAAVQGGFAQEWMRLEEQGDYRGKVELMASYLRMHLMPIEIEEDDEKFVFEMHPCGSGGHLILNGYYSPPINFLKVAKPQPMTYGRKDFPVYCCHGAINAMLTIEAGVPPLCYEDPSDELGKTPCKFYMYKDPKNVPAELYAKVGKKKGD